MGEVKHQVIMIKNRTPLDIVKDFDFDFCKVYYDGETLHVDNWDAILNFTSRINYNFGTRPERKQKYERRGFTIITDDNTL